MYIHIQLLTRAQMLD